MKKLRIIFIIISAVFFYTMLISALVRNIYLNRDGAERWGVLGKSIHFIAEIPSLAKQSMEPLRYLIPNSENKSKNVEELVYHVDKSEIKAYPDLLISYKDKKFGQKFELIDLQTGNVYKRWEPDNKLLLEKGYNIENPLRPAKGSDLHFRHPLLDADSSLVITAELTSLIAKIDKNSELVWLTNDRRYHHSLEFDHEGDIYVCSRPFLSKKYDFMPNNYDYYKEILIDDEITKIESNTGKVLFSKSIIEILIENGYERLLISKGQVISDPIHLNDIQPALSNSEYWEIGDLMVSCRNLSTVFLYRPSTNKILWLKEGPWYNQHDVDFLDGNKIVVFGNDVLREESVIDGRIVQDNLFFSDKRPINDIYVYHFENDSISNPYTQLMKNEDIRTHTAGRSEVLHNGDVFVEETTEGRIIFGDSVNKKIEYVKRIDDEHIARLFWSRLVY